MARRVEKIIEDAVFGNEEEFLKEAIREMVRKYEIQELDKRNLFVAGSLRIID